MASLSSVTNAPALLRRDNRGTQAETPGPTPLSVTRLLSQEGSDCLRQWGEGRSFILQQA